MHPTSNITIIEIKLKVQINDFISGTLLFIKPPSKFKLRYITPISNSDVGPLVYSKLIYPNSSNIPPKNLSPKPPPQAPEE